MPGPNAPALQRHLAVGEPVRMIEVYRARTAVLHRFPEPARRRGIGGGGVRGGSVHGETDEFGYNVARDPVHVHDLNATVLHLLGIDHEKLTYKFQGRHYRLTDVHGHIVKPILA